MGELLIRHNKLEYRGDSFTINDLYTLDFIDYSNSKASLFCQDSYFVNELFLSTFQPWMALKNFVQLQGITRIRMKYPSVLLHALCLDLADQGEVKLKGGRRTSFLLYWRIHSYISLWATAFYLLLCMWKIPQRETSDSHPENIFILSRSPASERKMQNFSFPKRTEDIKVKHSLYANFSRTKRMIWVLKSFFNSFSQLRSIRNHVQLLVGNHSVAIAYSFYGIRMVHTVLYEKLLDKYFQRHPKETVYTGNNLDRFSVVEEIMAKKHDLQVVCIPHGLEYGFRFPKGFSGDKFFATTKFAADYLNKMYQTTKFTFDEVVANKIFTVNKSIPYKERRIVFFTEPREVHVNIYILTVLLPLMTREGIRLSLKLHPKDNVKDYKSFDVDFIDDLEDALIGNICFARKSTTLLECIYNKSKAAAIVTNPKDAALFYTFPSLQTEEIYVAKTIDQLFEWITLNIKKTHNEEI
jgi:hypothetical protein